MPELADHKFNVSMTERSLYIGTNDVGIKMLSGDLVFSPENDALFILQEGSAGPLLSAVTNSILIKPAADATTVRAVKVMAMSGYQSLMLSLTVAGRTLNELSVAWLDANLACTMESN